MNVELLQNTELHIVVKAIRTCKNSHDKSDTKPHEVDRAMVDLADFHLDSRVLEVGPKDKALIERIANKHKHGSVLEHLSYTFDIKGISRACLQELARHRIASLSVRSTRYTLQALKDGYSFDVSEYDNMSMAEAKQYIVVTGNMAVDMASYNALCHLQGILQAGAPNDTAKYCLPEAFKTELIWTINARSLQNFLYLRTNKDALKEIRELAFNIYDNLPEEHKYLYKDSLNERVV